jgi:hypothetical protein
VSYVVVRSCNRFWFQMAETTRSALIIETT